MGLGGIVVYIDFRNSFASNTILYARLCIRTRVRIVDRMLSREVFFNSNSYLFEVSVFSHDPSPALLARFFCSLWIESFRFHKTSSKVCSVVRTLDVGQWIEK